VKHGTGHGRGRHRNARSPEPKRWLEVAPTVDRWKPEPKRKRSKPNTTRVSDLPPERPSWMDEREYAALIELREELA